MGWLDKLFRKDTKSVIYADTLDGYTPLFSQYGENIYASDVVQQAINCIVSEMKKLQITLLTILLLPLNPRMIQK